MYIYTWLVGGGLPGGLGWLVEVGFVRLVGGGLFYLVSNSFYFHTGNQ